MATPPWQVAAMPDAAGDVAAQPTANELAKQLALVGKRPVHLGADLSDSDESEPDSEEEERLRPPGPPDPEKCMVTGPGVSGGAAGSPMSFFVTCKDSGGKRVPIGGAHVEALIVPKLGAPKDENPVVLIKDNDDGSYTGIYTVSARGNYELTVEINGTPTGGSPFPVFFSPPESKADAEAAAAGAAAVPAGGLASTAQEVALMLGPELARLSAASEEAAAAMLAQQNSIGPAAHEAGVVFTTDEALQKRMMIVGNLSKSINAEQLQQLFGFCGSVTDCSLVGKANDYALIEFSKEEEARAALAMNNMSVMGSTIKVELVASAHKASPQGAPDPTAALQAHRMAQLQLAQMQQESLAAQVAQMRAAARTLPTGAGAAGAAVPANSQSQKAAAMAAAAALTKRLQGIGGASTSYREHSPPRKRAFSPPRKRRRTPLPIRRRIRTPSPIRKRPRSPTPPRRRHRSRSPASRSHSHRRSRSRGRGRSSGRDARGDDERRDKSRSRRDDRGADGSRRERSSRRSRSPVPTLPQRDGSTERGRRQESSRDRGGADRDRGRGRGGSDRNTDISDKDRSDKRRGSDDDGPACKRRDAADMVAKQSGQSPDPGDAADGNGSGEADATVAPAAEQSVVAVEQPEAAGQPAAAANGHAEAAASGREGRHYRRSGGDAAASAEDHGEAKRRRSSSPAGADERSGAKRHHHDRDRKDDGNRKERKAKEEKHKRHKSDKHRRHKRETSADAAVADANAAADTGNAAGADYGPASAEQLQEQEQLRQAALDKLQAPKQAEEATEAEPVDIDEQAT